VPNFKGCARKITQQSRLSVFAGISGGILNISLQKNCVSGHWNGKNRNNFCPPLNDFVKYVKKSRTFVLELKGKTCEAVRAGWKIKGKKYGIKILY
jgi:hypothetical protein